jgi:hypothetical protein
MVDHMPLLVGLDDKRLWVLGDTLAWAVLDDMGRDDKELDDKELDGMVMVRDDK